MIVEYVVFGILLIVMGGVQIWLRHGPPGRRVREDAAGRDGGGSGTRPSTGLGGPGTGRVWNAWTAILGFLGVVLGVVLVVLGLLGA